MQSPRSHYYRYWYNHETRLLPLVSLSLDIFLSIRMTGIAGLCRRMQLHQGIKIICCRLLIALPTHRFLMTGKRNLINIECNNLSIPGLQDKKISNSKGLSAGISWTMIIGYQLLLTKS